jgi:hypothetical protein
MANYRVPGPLCAAQQSMRVADGTTSLMKSPCPGAVAGAGPDHARSWDPTTLWHRARCFSRDDARVSAEAALGLLAERMHLNPVYGVYVHAREQLENILRAIHGGGIPTQAARDAVDIGVMAAKELASDDADPAGPCGMEFRASRAASACASWPPRTAGQNAGP